MNHKKELLSGLWVYNVLADLACNFCRLGCSAMGDEKQHATGLGVWGSPADEHPIACTILPALSGIACPSCRSSSM